jgi:hypothetical protein
MQGEEEYCKYVSFISPESNEKTHQALVSDHNGLHRPLHELCGEILHLLVSLLHPVIVYSIPSLVGQSYRRSKAHRSKLRWPTSGGATTIWLALLLSFDLA